MNPASEYVMWLPLCTITRDAVVRFASPSRARFMTHARLELGAVNCVFDRRLLC